MSDGTAGDVLPAREPAATAPSALRVAILLDSGPVPAWVARAIDDIQPADARVVLVVRWIGSPAARRAAPRGLRRLYDAVDARAFRIKRDPFAASELPAALRDAAVVSATPHSAGAEYALTDADCNAIAARQLDVVLDFGSHRLTGAALAIARYGIWSLAVGDPATDGADVIAGAALTPTALSARMPDGERVLIRSHGATDPLSARRNRARGHWKAAAFAARALRDLRDLGATWIAAAPLARTAAAPPAPAPSVTRFLGNALAARARRSILRRQWLLAYSIDPTLTGAAPVTQSLDRFTWLEPPPDRFWADPFVARHGDGWVVLFEEGLASRPAARISGVEIAADGKVGEPFPVLERDHHLSYPFLFQWNATWWMVPESARNRSVDLWRAVDFPRRWTLERTLLSDAVVDATLFEREGTWWMFCNIGQPGAGNDDELHLFYASSPLGPWQPHRRNPVKSTVRGSRPAGRPYQRDGAWYRPGQDGSGGYGSAIIVHQITALDPSRYEEVEVERLTPDFRRDLISMHTINAADGITVIDLRRVLPRWLLR